jgi:CRISPR system Cascade subunit CasC
MSKLFVDFHVIQTMPPSCVNRDDTGSPKTARYGGVQRARVSSQSWKRAMRLMFRDNFDEAELGIRTKRIVDVVAAAIRRLDESKNIDEARQLAEKAINAAKVSTQDSEARALFFISSKQAENLARLILGNEDPSKKEAQEALNTKGSGVDIALFGRMVADDPTLNTDATAQVAHSISTHQVDNEFDYYTAVDDCTPEDNVGAGMIGTIEFNSSTLYRYATVAVHELNRQIDDLDITAKVMCEFARAFITAMPTGKQNTFANRTLPDAVLVCLRTDQPINLVGAFEKPVRGTAGSGFVEGSCEQLVNYASSIYTDFSAEPVRSYVVGTGLVALGEQTTVPELLDLLHKETVQYLNDTPESNEV